MINNVITEGNALIILHISLDIFFSTKNSIIIARSVKIEFDTPLSDR